MKYYADSYYKEYIDSRYELTSRFAERIKSDRQFELAAEPESNIVCFRYMSDGQSEESLNKINSDIRDKIIKSGAYYIVQAELNGKIWLRLTIINPVTSEADLEDLLILIRSLGIG
jgi:L-2,4-diaminobutyrate decarboxylase